MTSPTSDYRLPEVYVDEKGRVVPATDASTESAADTDSQHSFISTVLDGDPRAFSSVCLSVPEGKSQDGAVIAHTRPASDLSVSSAIPHKAASASASASGPATVNAHLPASSSGETEITEGHVFVHVHHRPHGKPAAIPHCKAESSSADEPATTIPAIITRNQVEVGGVKLVYDPKAKSVGVTSQMEGLGDRSVSVDADMTKWYRTGARIDHLRRVVQKQREEE